MVTADIKTLVATVALATVLACSTQALAERKDVSDEPVYPAGPTYEDVVEEFCSRVVFPRGGTYMGVSVRRDNVICESVERSGNSFWFTCRARYSGRVLGVGIAAERVRVHYDNGHLKVDLGGLKGVLDTRSVVDAVEKSTNALFGTNNDVADWAKNKLGNEREYGFDAALEHPKGYAIFFKEDRYFRYDFDDNELDRKARIGHPGFKGIWTNGVDAALVHPGNGKAYFLKGDKYQSYDFDTNEASEPKRIGKKGFKGIWTDGIDAALIHPHNGKGYFIKGDMYQSYDFDKNEASEPRRIGDLGFKGVWTDGIDVALVHPKTKKGYFFRGSKYQRYNFETDRVEAEGVVGKTGWKGL